MTTRDGFGRPFFLRYHRPLDSPGDYFQGTLPGLGISAGPILGSCFGKAEKRWTDNSLLVCRHHDADDDAEACAEGDSEGDADSDVDAGDGAESSQVQCHIHY